MSQSKIAQPIGLLNHLIVWAREEVALQRELLGALEDQADAAAERSPDRLEATTLQVDVLLQRTAESSARRTKLFARLAEHWGVAPGTLTLGSIVARAGTHAAGLAEQRPLLRQAVMDVQRFGRQVHALLRLHQRVTSEVLTTLLGQEDDGSCARRGALLDAEA